MRALDQYKALRNVEFDCPFRVGHSGTVYEDVPNVYAPEVYHSDTDDVEVADDRWEPLTGYTGQYSYSGAVMHPSETLGGHLADDILTTPGVYVLVVVEVLDEDEPAGWAVLRYTDRGQHNGTD